MKTNLIIMSCMIFIVHALHIGLGVVPRIGPRAIPIWISWLVVIYAAAVVWRILATYIFGKPVRKTGKNDLQ